MHLVGVRCLSPKVQHEIGFLAQNCAFRISAPWFACDVADLSCGFSLDLVGHSCDLISFFLWLPVIPLACLFWCAQCNQKVGICFQITYHNILWWELVHHVTYIVKLMKIAIFPASSLVHLCIFYQTKSK